MDLALRSDVLLQQTDPGRASLISVMQDDWEGIAVGFVDIELWRLPAEVREDVPGYNVQGVGQVVPAFFLLLGK
jgi:amidase